MLHVKHIALALLSCCTLTSFGVEISGTESSSDYKQSVHNYLKDHSYYRKHFPHSNDKEAHEVLKKAQSHSSIPTGHFWDTIQLLMNRRAQDPELQERLQGSPKDVSIAQPRSYKDDYQAHNTKNNNKSKVNAQQFTSKPSNEGDELIAQQLRKPYIMIQREEQQLHNMLRQPWAKQSKNLKNKR